MITEQEPALDFELLHIYPYIFIITYSLVIFGPRVKGCTALPLKSDCMAICEDLASLRKEMASQREFWPFIDWIWPLRDSMLPLRY